MSNRGTLAASPAQSFPPAGKPQPTSLIAQSSEEHYKHFPKNFTPKRATRELAESADAAAKHVIGNRYFPKDSKFSEFEKEEYYNWNTKTQYGYFANPPDPKGEVRTRAPSLLVFLICMMVMTLLGTMRSPICLSLSTYGC